MSKFVLIIILTSKNYYYDGSSTTLNQEFDSLEQCQYVYQVLKEQQVKQDRNILSGGCFKK